MNKLLILLLLFLVQLSHGQVDQAFINHLQKNNFKKEERTYLKSFPLSKDSFAYYLSSSYIHYEEDSLFFEQYPLSKKLILSDSNKLLSYSAHFLGKPQYRDTWFNQFNSNTTPVRFRQMFSLYSQLQKNSSIDILQLPDPIQESYTRYTQANRKKPLLAATMSAFVPGLGKAYNGKGKRFLSTFLTNGMFIYQTYESVDKLGAKHPLSIANLVLASVFYMANVYGSYKDIIYFKQETKQQLFIDASNYYISEYQPY